MKVHINMENMFAKIANIVATYPLITIYFCISVN